MAKIKITGGDIKPQKAKVEGDTAESCTITVDGTDYLVKKYILKTEHSQSKTKGSLTGEALKAASWSSKVGGTGFSVLQGIASGMEKEVITFRAYLAGGKTFLAESETNVYQHIQRASPQLSDSQMAAKGKSDERIDRMLQDAPRVILEVKEKIAALEPQLDELKKQAEEGATFDDREDALEKANKVEAELRTYRNNEQVLADEIQRQENEKMQLLEDEKQRKEAEAIKQQKASEKESLGKLRGEAKKAKKLEKSEAKEAKKQSKLDIKAAKKQAKLDIKAAKRAAK